MASLPGSGYPAFMRTVTVRLGEQQFARLKRVARGRHVSKAQVLRHAFDQADAKRLGPPVVDLAADLAGSVNGPWDASTNPAYLDDFGE